MLVDVWLPIEIAVAALQGRDFAAWLGLVPRQIWTGGRANIQARNRYLRVYSGGLGGADPAAELGALRARSVY
jgi:hypothetical protein